MKPSGDGDQALLTTALGLPELPEPFHVHEASFQGNVDYLREHLEGMSPISRSPSVNARSKSYIDGPSYVISLIVNDTVWACMTVPPSLFPALIHARYAGMEGSLEDIQRRSLMTVIMGDDDISQGESSYAKPFLSICGVYFPVCSAWSWRPLVIDYVQSVWVRVHVGCLLGKI